MSILAIYLKDYYQFNIPAVYLYTVQLCIIRFSGCGDEYSSFAQEYTKGLSFLLTISSETICLWGRITKQPSIHRLSQGASHSGQGVRLSSDSQGPRVLQFLGKSNSPITYKQHLMGLKHKDMN